MALPRSTCPDSFASLGLGVLLERMERSASELERLRGELLVDCAPGARTPDELAQACAQLEDQGWLFGFVSGELGTDVLFERRETRGLELALDLVRDVLVRDGIELAPASLPALNTADPRANAICGAVARCVHAAHAVAAPPWSIERQGTMAWLTFRGGASPALLRELLDSARRIEGAFVRGAGDRLELGLPAGTLVWS